MDQNAQATDIHRNLRILVADDYEVNQKIAQLILQKEGYDVDIVADGQQAVEAHHQNQYNLILMDIQMPIMDGHEATKQIRKSEIQNPKSKIKSVPIIAMTGDAADGAFDEQQYPGMNDCLGKPLQREHLLAMAQKWGNGASISRTIDNPQAESDLPIGEFDESQSPLNLETVIQQFMGQEEIFVSVAHEFVDKAKTKIDAIRRAAKTADYEEIRFVVHAIKGGAANLTADRLAGLAAELETAVENQRSDQICDLTDQLAQEIDRLGTYIKQHPDLKK